MMFLGLKCLFRLWKLGLVFSMVYDNLNPVPVWELNLMFLFKRIEMNFFLDPFMTNPEE